MARNTRSIFAKEEATAVVDSASALLVELPEERLYQSTGRGGLLGMVDGRSSGGRRSSWSS